MSYDLFTEKDWDVRAGISRKGDGRITWAALLFAALIPWVFILLYEALR